MTKTDATLVCPVLVAIDIAKHRNEVLIAVRGRERRRRLIVRNIREDHERLVDTLVAYDVPLAVGFEPTGDYHRTLAWRLHHAGLSLKLTSSLSLARAREAMHKSWDKNDRKDAQVMLHMMQTGLTQTWHNPLVHSFNNLQELSNTHAVISKTKTEFWHRLRTHYLPLYFLEAERFAGNSRSNWFLAFLVPFPTPGSIA
ncbi:MAG: transposase [Pseudomonadota bacterium]